ncbi:unnamed protein product [Caenorhabditis angaria]|uniref:Uncharacterized protein n=1 Tax=Caenorhabditis angaria TaxID=860376 RepID=A0A9P1MX36_9PELO|nr:unnamed protein product [Caenorhabditis angaria]
MTCFSENCHVIEFPATKCPNNSWISRKIRKACGPMDDEDYNSVNSDWESVSDEPPKLEIPLQKIYNGHVPPIEITRSNSPCPSHLPSPTENSRSAPPKIKKMTESSPEPLDDLYDVEQQNAQKRRPVVRWQSMKEEASSMRRVETLPEMHNHSDGSGSAPPQPRGRRARHRRRQHLRRANNNDEDGDSHGSLQHSFLRVPVGLSGRSSPSIASMGSEPESCIDDTQFLSDDDEIGGFWGRF